MEKPEKRGAKNKPFSTKLNWTAHAYTDSLATEQGQPSIYGMSPKMVALLITFRLLKWLKWLLPKDKEDGFEGKPENDGTATLHPSSSLLRLEIECLVHS